VYRRAYVGCFVCLFVEGVGKRGEGDLILMEVRRGLHREKCGPVSNADKKGKKYQEKDENALRQFLACRAGEGESDRARNAHPVWVCPDG